MGQRVLREPVGSRAGFIGELSGGYTKNRENAKNLGPPIGVDHGWVIRRGNLRRSVGGSRVYQRLGKYSPNVLINVSGLLPSSEVRESFSVEATRFGRVLVVATIKDRDGRRGLREKRTNRTSVPPDGRRLGRFYQ